MDNDELFEFADNMLGDSGRSTPLQTLRTAFLRGIPLETIFNSLQFDNFAHVVQQNYTEWKTFSSCFQACRSISLTSPDDHAPEHESARTSMREIFGEHLAEVSFREPGVCVLSNGKQAKAIFTHFVVPQLDFQKIIRPTTALGFVRKEGGNLALFHSQKLLNEARLEHFVGELEPYFIEHFAEAPVATCELVCKALIKNGIHSLAEITEMEDSQVHALNYQGVFNSSNQGLVGLGMNRECFKNAWKVIRGKRKAVSVVVLDANRRCKEIWGRGAKSIEECRNLRQQALTLALKVGHKIGNDAEMETRLAQWYFNMSVV